MRRFSSREGQDEHSLSASRVPDDAWGSEETGGEGGILDAARVMAAVGGEEEKERGAAVGSRGQDKRDGPYAALHHTRANGPPRSSTPVGERAADASSSSFSSSSHSASHHAQTSCSSRAAPSPSAGEAFRATSASC